MPGPAEHRADRTGEPVTGTQEGGEDGRRSHQALSVVSKRLFVLLCWCGTYRVTFLHQPRTHCRSLQACVIVSPVASQWSQGLAPETLLVLVTG